MEYIVMPFVGVMAGTLIFIMTALFMTLLHWLGHRIESIKSKVAKVFTVAFIGFFVGCVFVNLTQRFSPEFKTSGIEFWAHIVAGITFVAMSPTVLIICKNKFKRQVSE